MNNQAKGFISLLITSLFFGSFGIWIRMLSEVLTTYQQIVFRNLFALFFTIVVLIARKTSLRAIKQVNLKNLFAFSFVVPLSVIFYVFSIVNEKISVVTFSFFGGTIITSWILGKILLKEKVTIIGWLSLILVLVGLVIMNLPFNIYGISFGFLLALFSGSLDGLANYLRKIIGGTVDKFILVLCTAIGGVLVSGAMLIITQGNLNFMSSMSTNIWLVGALFGLLLVTVNFLLLYGFQRFNVSLGSIVLSAELFFASLFGLIIFREIPSFNEIIGGVFIFIAAIAPSLYELKAEKTI